MSAGLWHQGGFVRGVIWLGLTVAVVALVLLDGMALFSVRQSTEECAAGAAREARNAYVQTQDVGSAELAAEAYLSKNHKTLADFEAGESTDGSLVFRVTARGHAETYAFKYLRYVGLEAWVNRATDVKATGSAT